MKIKNWPPEWRDELYQLLEAATAIEDVPGRRRWLLDGLTAAERAKRPWVSEVLRDFKNGGADRLLKFYDDRMRRVAFTNPRTGLLLNKPSKAGVRVVDKEGEQHLQRELFSVMTWDQLLEVRRSRVLQARAAGDTVAMIDRLLELHVMCPEAVSPAEAADILGLNLDDWLLNGGEENNA